MDRKQLIGEVAARHGILLEQDDPAFLLVTLAELMLRDAHSELIAATERVLVEYEEAGKRLQEGVGAAIAVAVQHQLRADIGRLRPADAQASGQSDGSTRLHYSRLLALSVVGLVAGLLLFLAGFACGRVN